MIDASSTGTGLLHNMSARPRTEVRRTIAASGGEWTTFGPLKRLNITADDRVRLDRHWADLHLTGAALIIPAGTLADAGVTPRRCRDRDLELNVLLRTRGNLLLFTMGLVEETYDVLGREYATDDPRLLAVAR